MGKSIHITKVVSKDFLTDFFTRIQNMFGVNLTSYEKMIDKGMKQIKDELGNKKMKWYRYEISELTSGAMAIVFYGETK